MRRLPRLLLAAVLALPAAAGGCGNSADSKTNPDLKVPDVPAGGGRSQPKEKDKDKSVKKT